MPSLIPNGPNIPNKVFQDHEKDRLVLFCGAGVSVPAGLPLFSGLVDKMYGLLLAKPELAEKIALERNQYDVALRLLEERIEPKLVRLAVKDVLESGFNGNLDLHRWLLELANVSGLGSRLVTTNFDELFAQFKKGNLENISEYKKQLSKGERSSYGAVFEFVAE